MFSAHFAQLKWENHHPPPQNFLELLRIQPSIQRSAFLADSMRVSTKSESECLTPPAGLKGKIKEEKTFRQGIELSISDLLPKKFVSFPPKDEVVRLRSTQQLAALTAKRLFDCNQPCTDRKCHVVLKQRRQRPSHQTSRLGDRILLPYSARIESN